MEAYVFGAHSRGRTTAVYLQGISESFRVTAYLYDNDEPNGTELDGIPVIRLGNDSKLDTSLPVFIGTRGVYHKRITEKLKQVGFSDIRPVTVDLDTKLRTEYIRKKFGNQGRKFTKIEKVGSDTGECTCTGSIYVVRSEYDKPIENDAYEYKEYEKQIQAGAALTDIRLPECQVYDDIGDNISKMNRQMCEITALYWIWKHTNEDYVGLVHYRRHFLLSDDWISQMRTVDADILLPIPMYLGPSIGENYRFRHVSEDMDTLLKVIKEKYESDYKAVEKCFGDTVFFPCNMFVMERELLNAYCSWLFEILFRVIELIGTHEDTYENRYPAFMAEWLLTLYCSIHQDSMKIVYADKNFLA